MSLPAGKRGNFVSRYFTNWGAQIRGEMDDEDRRLYLRSLRGTRTWVICLKIFANILFLFAWSYVSLDDKTYRADYTFEGKGFWIDFSVYAGVSVLLPFFSFLGLFREGIVLSHLWFEIGWLLIVSGYDGYLISRQARFWPRYKDYGKEFFDDPYLTISQVSLVLTLIGLALDVVFSLYWSVFLSVTAWLNRSKYPKIWFSEASNFPWLLPTGRSDRSSGAVQFIFGAPREVPPSKSIPAGLKRWFLRSTMFRKSGPLEPFSHSLLRGTVASLAWVAIIAYAMFNCVINPIHQFTKARGLPSRPLLQDSHSMKTFGNISAFIVVDVIPASQYNLDEGLPQEMYEAIYGGLWGGVWDPIKNEDVDYTYIKNGDYAQIELWLQCGAIWDVIKFRTSANMPDSRPYVYMSYNSSAYQARPILNAGLWSFHFNRPDTTEFSSVITGLNENPNEVEPGVTFDLAPGQNLNIDVGRRRDYNVRGTFLDLIGGFSQPPSVYVTYPILSVTSSPVPIDPEITALSFYPMWSAYNDELYEQYLDQTVLTGLSKTGGLYSAFEVVFVLFFGRSLLAALFGKNNTNPFGRIANTVQGDKFRRRLQEAYPGIDGEDPKQRVEATCAFLHDFILDLKPLNIKPTYMTRRPGRNGTEEASAGSDVTGGEKDIEAAHVTPSLRLHSDSEAANGSGKV